MLEIGTKAPFFVREGACENCYGIKEGAQKYIGIRRGILTEYESRIQYVKGVLEIAEGIWLIPHRKSDYSKIALRNDLYTVNNGKREPDDFAHEQSLVLDTKKGLIVFNSCSHTGMVNILADIREMLGRDDIYVRSFMAANGNPNQWGPTNWPPENLIKEDISAGKSYVVMKNNEIAGVFFFDQGYHIEPTYDQIEDGSWISDSPYGVIHRIAGNGKAKGIGHAAIEWAWEQCPHLRIDTHPDNTVMQKMLAREGFVHRGTIYVREDNDARMAFERIGSRRRRTES